MTGQGENKRPARVLIMIAAYNEQENIRRVVENLNRNYPQYDYIVINDGSSDKTLDILKQNGFHYLCLPQNLGIGGAIQTGYRYAAEHGYDIAIQLDGDGQHDPQYIADLVRPIVEGKADYCIGSRFVTHEGFQSSGARRTGIRFLSGLIYLMTLHRIKDVTSGFRAVDRMFIETFAADYPADYPEPKAIVDAVMRQGRIQEIPVVMHERTGGVSSINLRRAVYYMIKVTLDIIVCRIGYGFRRGPERRAEETGLTMP